MNKIAWVTGGGSGIGKALAQELYRDGWRVVISGRRADVLTQAAEEIKTTQTTGDVWAVPGDVSDPAYAASLYPKLKERWGDVDLLINNAGENPHHSFDQTTPEEFEQNFRVNCLSAIRCAKAVLPAMKLRRSGTIVNVSSVLGKWASAASPAYSVSKYALAGFTDTLRQDLLESGVHVIGVYSGFIQTALTAPFVKAGSLHSKMGKSPAAMASVILTAVRRRKDEVLYPWYVPWVLRLYRLFPRVMETIRKELGH